MGGFYRKFRGEADASGVVTLREDPDYSNGKYTYPGWIGSMGVRHMTLQVEDLDGSVELQGNNGDPTVAGEWQTVEELTADGRVVVNEDAIAFIRVNATAINSGTAKIMLTMEG